MLAVTVGAGLARDWRRGRLKEVGALPTIAGKARSYRWINKIPECKKSLDELFHFQNNSDAKYELKK